LAICLFSETGLLNSSLKTRALRESTTPSEAGLDLGRLDLILVENADHVGGYTIQNNQIKKSTLNQAAIAQKTSKK
jgi:hypothetical protein